MRLAAPTSQTNTDILPGLWVSEKVYSLLYNLPRPTLCTWRYQDRKSRSRSAPQLPGLQILGDACVRYLLPLGTYDEKQVQALIAAQPKR